MFQAETKISDAIGTHPVKNCWVYCSVCGYNQLTEPWGTSERAYTYCLICERYFRAKYTKEESSINEGLHFFMLSDESIIKPDIKDYWK